MSDARTALIGELLRGAGMPLDSVRTSHSMRDGIVIVERKVWTAPLGDQGEWVDGEWVDDPRYAGSARGDQEHAQDTWWLSLYTHDRLDSGWLEYARNRADVELHDLGPVELPRRGPAADPGRPIVRCLLDGAAWDNINPRGIYPEGDRRFRPLDSPEVISMRTGLLEIDVREFLLDTPWYVNALRD